MGVAFNRGQQLTQKDLYINVRNTSNVLVDPYSISYNIFDTSAGVEVLMPPPNQQPIRVGVGSYYSDYKIPDAANIGSYMIQWQLQETATSPVTYIDEKFAVVGLDVKTTAPNLNSTLQDLILRLRNMLRDNNPDRNYHFRPPTDRNVIRGYTEKFGYIWETEELVMHLQTAVEYISITPPAQVITLNNIPYGWTSLVLMQAAVFAIQALTLNWIEEEFGYSIQGISLDIEKSSKYQSMADTLAERVETTLEKAKQTVKVTKGLQQSRNRVGAQGVLGPYTGRGSVNPRNWVGDSLGRPDY